MPVLGPQPSPLAHGEVAIFHPVAHLLGCACASVGTDIGFAAHFAAPLDVLVGAESVRVFCLPSLVVDRLAVWSYAVKPVIGRDEASTRPTHYRCLNLFQCFNDIGAEAVLVAERIAWVEDAAIDLIVEVLDELPENHRVVGDGLRSFCYANLVLPHS